MLIRLRFSLLFVVALGIGTSACGTDEDENATDASELASGQSGLSFSHGGVKTLFGADSAELRAVKLADLMKPDKAADYPWMSLSDKYNEAQWVIRESKRFKNGRFDTNEERIVGDRLFPSDLKEPLARVAAVVGIKMPGGWDPAFRYEPVTARAIEKAPLYRETVRTVRPSSVPAATLAPLIGEDAVATMLELQGSPPGSDVRYTTLQTASESSIFVATYPGAVEKAKTAFVPREVRETSGPESLEEKVFDKSGVRVVALMKQRLIPADLNRYPFRARTVKWRIEAREGTIVVVDPGRVNLYPASIGGTYWDAKVWADRIGPEGTLVLDQDDLENDFVVKKAPMTIRVLDSKTRRIAAIELPRLAQDLRL